MSFGACSFDPTAAADLEPVAAPDASIASAEDGIDEVEGPETVPPQPVSGLGLLVSETVPEGPVVDGELDALWQDRLLAFPVADAMLLPLVHDDYAFDAEVRFASVHTDLHIYFVFDIRDTRPFWQATVPLEDSLTVYIDGMGDRDGPHREDDHRFRLSTKGIYSSHGPAEAQLDAFELERYDDGFRFEMALSRDWLSADEIGFDLALNDNDQLGDPAVDAIAIWYADDAPRCDECCSSGPSGLYCDTTYYGSLLLQQ